VPRKAIEKIGASVSRHIAANVRRYVNLAGERPEDSSRSREYLCVKKMWNMRSSDSGPK
jgi:hypothetical protein